MAPHPLLQQLIESPNFVPILISLAAVLAVVPFLLHVLGKSSKQKSKPFLDPEEYKPLKLTEKNYITHNTLRLRFELPDPKQRLGLPTGQHISFKATAPDGKEVFRSYTPVTDDDHLGSVEFVIKVYPQGKMSQVLHNLKVGDNMLMRGPKGRMTYKRNMKKHIGMVAGGTGITPMYQVMAAILKDPSDKTQVSVVFGNLTKQDILLKAELDALQELHGHRLKVYHVLNTPPADWTMGSGFITPEILKAHLPPPSPDTLILQCGPPPMVEAMKKHFDTLGYDAEMQFHF